MLFIQPIWCCSIWYWSRSERKKEKIIIVTYIQQHHLTKVIYLCITRWTGPSISKHIKNLYTYLSAVWVILLQQKGFYNHSVIRIHGWKLKTRTVKFISLNKALKHHFCFFIWSLLAKRWKISLVILVRYLAGPTEVSANQFISHITDSVEAWKTNPDWQLKRICSSSCSKINNNFIK